MSPDDAANKVEPIDSNEYAAMMREIVGVGGIPPRAGALMARCRLKSAKIKFHRFNHKGKYRKRRPGA